MFSLKNWLCVLAVIGSGSVFLGLDVCSYFNTTTKKISQNIKGSVPIQFEIDRAKNMLDSILPEIKENMALIAEEEVKVLQLQNEIDTLDGKMQTTKEEMLILKSDLEENPDNQTFVYGGRKYTRSQVETDLSKRLKNHQLDQVNLENKLKILGIKQTNLVTARSQLQAYLNNQKELEVAIEQLQSRLKMVELAKSTTPYSFDESQLGKIKELVSDLNSRVAVEEQYVNNTNQFQNDIVLTENDNTKNKDIVFKVSDYLEASAKKTDTEEK